MGNRPKEKPSPEKKQPTLEPQIPNSEYLLDDRAIAVWALACVSVLLPLGLALLQILWNGQRLFP